MGRFNMWMANLMRGRYGMDQMNRTLSIVALILIAANLFLRMRIINWLAVVLLIYIYCRAFSRNINRRAAENQRYLQFAGSVRSKFGRGPGCGEKLRVPKGAGKINISCPHCHTKFTKKV